MMLHIIVAGEQVFANNIEPGRVERVLQALNDRLESIAKGRRVAVTLDSDRHSNVTYLLNRRNS